MDFSEFVDATGLLRRSELDRARLLAFFHLRKNGTESFSGSEIAGWFQELGLARPNITRLRTRLSRSKEFVRAERQGRFRLHAREVATLDAEFPGLREPTDAVASQDTILPRELYAGTRGYIESLALQINASYEHNIFDGCAVLMRRLLEILLIHAYEHLGIASAITSGDRYADLNAIITNAASNTTLKLSKEARESLDTFRRLGNFSAHKIFFTCRRSDIRNTILDYRVAIEELLYRAGIKK